MKIIAAGLGAIVILSACVAPSAQEAEPQPTVTVTAPSDRETYVPPPSDVDGTFYQFVCGESSNLCSAGQSALVEGAEATCDALRSGATAEDVLAAALAAEFAPSDAAVLLGASIGAYCQEQGYKLDGP